MLPHSLIVLDYQAARNRIKVVYVTLTAHFSDRAIAVYYNLCTVIEIAQQFTMKTWDAYAGLVSICYDIIYVMSATLLCSTIK